IAAYISSLVPDFHQAEDVLDQVALTVVRKFSVYDSSRPFVNWAIGVAKFEILKHRRGKATDKHVFNDDLIAQVTEVYEEMAPELDERRAFLRLCLDEVSGRSREALQLRYFDDLKPAKIAERLGMKSGAVRVMLHRVRATVRECMERRMNDLASE
ncbi:MAG: sigma-70 family RNA polymerase sigma factor, partial [Planctomycetales bacterium]